jgi:hypothetical protein
MRMKQIKWSGHLWCCLVAEEAKQLPEAIPDTVIVGTGRPSAPNAPDSGPLAPAQRRPLMCSSNR